MNKTQKRTKWGKVKQFEHKNPNEMKHEQIEIYAKLLKDEWSSWNAVVIMGCITKKKFKEKHWTEIMKRRRISWTKKAQTKQP